MRGKALHSLFLLYAADLLRLVKSHNLHPHSYADDTQIYGFCPAADAPLLQEQMSACVDDVAVWMQSNRLQLNTSGVHQVDGSNTFLRFQYVSATTS